MTDDQLVQALYTDPRGRTGNHTFDHEHPTGLDYGQRASGRVYPFHVEDVQFWLARAQETGAAPIARPVNEDVTRAILNAPRVQRQAPAAPQQQAAEPPREDPEEVARIEGALQRATQERTEIEQAAERAAKQPAQQQPAQQFDLGAIPGITDAVRDGMQAAGLTTPVAIREAGTDGLTAIRGIGTVTAERILEFVEEESGAARDADSDAVWF